MKSAEAFFQKRHDLYRCRYTWNQVKLVDSRLQLAVQLLVVPNVTNLPIEVVCVLKLPVIQHFGCEDYLGAVSQELCQFLVELEEPH